MRLFDETFPRFVEGWKQETPVFGDAAFERFYLQYHRLRFRHLFSTLPSSDASLSILDCGLTPFTVYLKRTYPHYRICGIDINEDAGRRCQREEITFAPCDLTRDSIPRELGTFDVIVFAEVLEHLVIPPQDLFSRLRAAARPDGRLIVSTPNLAALLNRLRLALSASPLDNWQTVLTAHAPGYGHVREFTMGEVASMLSGAGWTVIDAQWCTYWDSWRLRRSLKGISGGEHVLRVMVKNPLLLIPYHLLCALVPQFRSGLQLVARPA